MKIGILGSRGIPNQYGGFEEFATHLAEGLVKLGAQVSVYCSNTHPYREAEWNGVQLIHCSDPEDKLGTAGQFIYDFHCIKDSRQRNFDIIYQLGYTSSSVWYRLLPDGPAIVTNMDGLEWKRSKYSKAVRRFLKYAEKLAVISSDNLVADSKAIQQYLMDTYQTPSDFISYGAHIFNNPDEETLIQSGVKPDEYFLLIARMQQDNHIEEIIKGVIDSKTNIPLLIIGNTKNKFGHYLTKTYQSETIRFLGGIFNRSALDNLRYFSKMYFHGHSAGGTNPSLLEAMASQALICAHKNAFNMEVLQQNAFYFEDYKQISEIIQSLNSKLSTKKSFVENNLAAIRNKYNWDKIIDKYYKLFSELL